MNNPNQTYQLKQWLVDPIASTINNSEESRQLDHKVMQLLCCLIEHQGDIISRDQLLELIWPNQVITDDVLNVTISTLRKQLDDTARNPQFIKTIARTGYQLIAEAELLGNAIQQTKTKSLSISSENNHWKWLSGFAIIFLTLFIYFKYNKNVTPDNDLPITETLAVLPFDLYSANKEDEYIADGLTEAIINRLVDIENLRITSRTSVMTFKNDKPDIKTIAKQLNVKWILEGSIQIQNNQLNVTAQLIDTTTDQHQWSETYQRPLNDLFKIQTDIASEIAARFEHDNSQSRQSKVEIPALAYDAYIKGRYHFKNYDIPEAEQAFKEAISAFPEYALAYAGLAECEFIKAYTANENVAQLLDKAGVLALKAAAIDSYPARVQLVLATYYTYTIHDYDKAGIAFNNAYKRDNQDVMIQEWYSTYLIITRQFNVARKMVKHMMSVNPLAYNKLTKYMILYYAKDYSAALDEIKLKAPFLNENFVHSLYVWTYLAMGDVEGLLNSVDKLFARYKVSEKDIKTFKQLLSNEGIQPAVSFMYDKIESQLAAYSKAEFLAWAGRSEEAIEILTSIISSRKLDNIKFAVEPAFESLHGYPEFQQLVKMYGLEAYE